MNSKEEEKPKSTTYKVSRRHITCDAPNCNEHSPTKRCSRCKCVFYCSVSCQKADWKTKHKVECEGAHEAYFGKDTGQKKSKEKQSSQNKQEDTLFDQQQECAICFESLNQVKNVTKLECGHAYCFKCLSDYQKHSIEPCSYQPQNDSDDQDSTVGRQQQLWESLRRRIERKNGHGPGMTCPLCRTKIPDLRESTFNKINLKVTNMHRLAFDEAYPDILKEELTEEVQEKLNSLCQEIIEEMQPLYDLHEDKVNLKLDLVKCEILHMNGDSETSLKLFDKVFHVVLQSVKDFRYIQMMSEQIRMGDLSKGQEDECHKSIVKRLKKDILFDDEFLVDLMLKKIEVHKHIGDWDGASKDIRTILSTYLEKGMLTNTQTRSLFMSISQIGYETGMYDMSIDFGERSIMYNRHFPGVHTYIAKSYQAKGDLENADKMFSRAVLYEAPWDQASLSRAQKQYDDFRREVNLKEA